MCWHWRLHTRPGGFPYRLDPNGIAHIPLGEGYASDDKYPIPIHVYPLRRYRTEQKGASIPEQNNFVNRRFGEVYDSNHSTGIFKREVLTPPESHIFLTLFVSARFFMS